MQCCVFLQMQQQELAQMRQRDANLTALAAIGPRKKRKLDSPGGAGAGAEVRLQETSHQAGTTGSGQTGASHCKYANELRRPAQQSQPRPE